MTAGVIDVHGLSKRFGDRRVVEGFTLRVPQGEICGFLGGNGSGKTTTIRMLCGLLTPDAGEGTCIGLDIIRQAEKIRRQVGYMTQRFSFYADLTVQENLEFVARLYQLPNRPAAVRGVMDRMELGPRAKQLCAQLSGGWKQRMALAACVLHQPRLLLLDEPTAGVDAKARRAFWDLISDMAADGMTVLVSTHYMDEAERCHRVVYLSGGKLIVEGRADDVVRNAALAVWEAGGDGIGHLVHRARETPGLESATVIGRALRVVGTNENSVQQAVASLNSPGITWQKVPARLDDVFIHLLGNEEKQP
jgi:ABC-type multidrug transport system ATPase subunit